MAFGGLGARRMVSGNAGLVRAKIATLESCGHSRRFDESELAWSRRVSDRREPRHRRGHGPSPFGTGRGRRSVIFAHPRSRRSRCPGAVSQQSCLDATAVVSAIESGGGRVIAIEADLSDVDTPARLLDAAETALGPVDILINNASGWVADTFSSDPAGRFGNPQLRVSAQTIDRQFTVDARGASLLISEFARRHAARGATWGRIVSLTSGGPTGFPNEVSYGAAKAALENYTMSAAFELAALGITANVVQPPVTDTGWVTEEVRQHVAATTRPNSRRQSGRSRRCYCLSRLGRRATHYRKPNPPAVGGRLDRARFLELVLISAAG